ncbi:MAG: cobalt-precorrin-5B (C(1))-methyltransferase CbiD [Microcoleaceae cyanobacterium]
MTSAHPRSGYTLPVFACAAAVAALRHLQTDDQATNQGFSTVSIDLVNPSEMTEIPIEQVARLRSGAALAIARSDPGDNLDLTRNTPIWAMVEWVHEQQSSPSSENPPEQIVLIGGEGIGYNRETEAAAIYSYARQLFHRNLVPFLTPKDHIQVTIILPEGRHLAQRTSNEAFGIVEGLSLLGTTGISQPLSVPGQLELYQAELQKKAQEFNCLVFCLGENGLDLAQNLGIPPEQTLKTANWLGPMLVAAALAGVQSILLFGYHGKLIKLAGGIFHTHHHLADGRLEILTAHCANLGLSTEHLQSVFNCKTAESALNYLRTLDVDQPVKYSPQISEATAGVVPKLTGDDQLNWGSRVYDAIAITIDKRATAYIWNNAQRQVIVGSVLFDRNRQILTKSAIGDTLLAKICYPSRNNLF